MARGLNPQESLNSWRNSSQQLPQLRDVDLVLLQDSGAMHADNTPPIRKRLAAEAKGAATDPINLAIAREVLRRVRDGELPIQTREEKPWGT